MSDKQKCTFVTMQRRLQALEERINKGVSVLSIGTLLGVNLCEYHRFVWPFFSSIGSSVPKWPNKRL